MGRAKTTGGLFSNTDLGEGQPPTSKEAVQYTNTTASETNAPGLPLASQSAQAAIEEHNKALVQENVVEEGVATRHFICHEV